MRTIEWTGQFKRDYRRESKGQHRTTLDSDLFPVIDLLANDSPLEFRCRDHALTGEWKDYRDCHIKPDLVLICQKSAPTTLRLVRLGSHSELERFHGDWKRVVPLCHGRAWPGHPRLARSDHKKVVGHRAEPDDDTWANP